MAPSGRHATIGVVTVIGLGAWCDYVSEREHRDRLSRPPFSYPSHEVEQALEQFRGCASFRVQEFAVLVDGRRLTLTDDVSGQRGFSSRTGSYGRRSAPIDPWALLTLEGLEASVRTTVLRRRRHRRRSSLGVARAASARPRRRGVAGAAQAASVRRRVQPAPARQGVGATARGTPAAAGLNRRAPLGWPAGPLAGWTLADSKIDWLVRQADRRDSAAELTIPARVWLRPGHGSGQVTDGSVAAGASAATSAVERHQGDQDHDGEHCRPDEPDLRLRVVRLLM